MSLTWRLHHHNITSSSVWPVIAGLAYHLQIHRERLERRVL